MTGFVEDAAGRPTIEKDPDAKLDYSWDWSTWLAGSTPADTIQAYQVTLENTVSGVVENTAHADGIVTAMILGGEPKEKIRAVCRITTASGKIDERSVWLKIKDR